MESFSKNPPGTCLFITPKTHLRILQEISQGKERISLKISPEIYKRITFCFFFENLSPGVASGNPRKIPRGNCSELCKYFSDIRSRIHPRTVSRSPSKFLQGIFQEIIPTFLQVRCQRFLKILSFHLKLLLESR